MANLTQCPDCGREISRRAAACPGCGSPLKQRRLMVQKHPKKRGGCGCAATLFLVIFVLPGAGFLGWNYVQHGRDSGVWSVSEWWGDFAEERRSGREHAAAQRRAAADAKINAPENLALRAELAGVIEQLQRDGLLGGISSTSVSVKAVVPPAWRLLDFEDKEAMGKMLLAWGRTYNPDLLAVRFLDSRTNKEAGSYQDGWGLKVE